MTLFAGGYLMKGSTWAVALVLAVIIVMVGSRPTLAASPLRHGPQKGITEGKAAPNTGAQQGQPGAVVKGDSVRRSGNYIEPHMLFRPVFIWQGKDYWPLHRVSAG